MIRVSASLTKSEKAAYIRPSQATDRLHCAAALLVFGLLAFVESAHAADAACTPHAGPDGRPAVGLVLSGGGARGYAHLGVLKVLEENRIPIDCIAATSMGSVVGGLYASGMTAQEMERRLAQVNLADIAFDVTERADLPQSQREDEQLYAGSLSLGFGSNGFRLPAGLVQGNRLQALPQDWTAAVPGNASFNELPIPFCAIATDLQTGQKVVLENGSSA
jgi:NTE family protein